MKSTAGDPRSYGQEFMSYLFTLSAVSTAVLTVRDKCAMLRLAQMGFLFGRYIMKRVPRLFLAAMFVLSTSRFAIAQVPAHYPGYVCYTPTFWCWAQPPGPPGSPCICYAYNGPVWGTLG